MSVFTGTEIKGSDNQLYRFLGQERGGQWAKVTSSGKTSQMATRSMTLELDRLAAQKNYSTRPSVFDNLLLKGIRSGKIPAQTQKARDWYRGIAKGQDTSTKDLLSEKTRLTNKIVPGKMYFFQYDPKHASTLPYYDMFPLIFPIEKYNDGFLGINFHYLPLVLRAKLMDALYGISSNTDFDETTKLNISYSILKGAAKYKPFEPTLHRYLSNHVQSRFIEIYSSEWDIALFLPTSQFKKASEAKVHRDSRYKLR